VRGKGGIDERTLSENDMAYIVNGANGIGLRVADIMSARDPLLCFFLSRVLARSLARVWLLDEYVDGRYTR
jgi:hypothetical protein